MHRSILKVSGKSRCGIHLVLVLIRAPFSRWQLWPALIAAWVPLSVGAQAPDLLWTTNVGARLFAVDDQTNVYASTGGSVIELNASGQALQTNSFCPLPGFAQRDAAGNIYFAGAFPLPCQFCTVTPVDFGGVTLSNGLFYIAKYNSEGSLIWAREFGPHMSSFMRQASANDFRTDGAGDFYVAYNWSDTSSGFRTQVARFDSMGTNAWISDLATGYNNIGYVRFGPIFQSNNYAAVYGEGLSSPQFKTLLNFNSAGSVVSLGYWNFESVAAERLYAHSAGDSFGNIYDVELGVLTKFSSSGGIIWSNYVGSLWTIAPDQYDGAHLAADSGQLSRYDPDGSLVWTLNLPSTLNSMLLDSRNNRFFSLANGLVGRIGAETLSAPAVTTPPQSQTVLVGSDVTLSVSATGFSPLRYSWLLNGTPLAGKTNSTLNLANVAASQAGLYSVVVSNIVNAVTSAPALLRVKYVEIYSGNEPLTNGDYFFTSPPTLTIRSAYTNGSSFYTLDGSPPSFNSFYYSAPFTLQNNATVRAIGYSADFSQSEEADAVNATVLLQHTLTASASGGGSVTLNPPGGTYANTNIVTATATPASGWSFLYWLGDIGGTNPVVNVSMERDKIIQAVFGTALSTTTEGNGQILLSPAGGVYPYGTVIRLTALPQPGNYFGFWGNAASGNTNPLYFALTNPSPTISSIFGALSSGQVALTVLINGRGQVTVDPRANVYSTEQGVMLTAMADPGQSFLGWSGDASGTQNPLSLIMTQSKVVNANFTGSASVQLDRAKGDGLTSAGFRFSILSDPQLAWRVRGSSNLTSWQSLGTVTNSSTEVQFTDPEALNSARRFYQVLPSE